jgi:hypothetical protein
MSLCHYSCIEPRKVLAPTHQRVAERASARFGTPRSRYTARRVVSIAKFANRTNGRGPLLAWVVVRLETAVKPTLCSKCHIALVDRG